MPDRQGVEADRMIESLFWDECVSCGTGTGTSKSYSPALDKVDGGCLDGWAHGATGRIVIRAFVEPARYPYMIFIPCGPSLWYQK